jgi:cyanophycinase
MTVATEKVEEAGEEYKRVFERLGAKSVEVVDVSSREDAHRRESLKTLERATAIFFTGGDQLHVTSLIGGSEMDLLLHQMYEEGVVIAGTSAGAAMMSNSMMVAGPPEENPKFGTVKLGPGVEFLLGGVIDTHFSQRGRYGRLISAIAHYPHDLGIGIDENTAIVVKDDKFEVIGEGAVAVIDAGSLTYTNVPDLADEEALALYGVTLHILPARHRFDMRERKPIVEEHSPAQEDQSTTVKRTSKPKKSTKTKRDSGRAANKR